MADAETLRSTQRAVDNAALARIRARLAGADEPPWLHGEVARRMVDRLPIFRQQPRQIVDWYGHDRASAPLLAQACAGARVQRVDPWGLPADVPSAAAPWWSPRRWRGERHVPLQPVAGLVPAAADMLWAHMGLHWCADPLAEMRRWQALLAAEGLLMFSTLGPGSMPSLRALADSHGWPPLSAPLVDMHDLGDMLLEAGFAEPVMDQESLTLHWPDASALLAELRMLGGNAHPKRHAGLRTPRWKRELLTALTPADGSRPAMVFEVVYGHAVRGRVRTPVAPETRVGLDDMRSILRR